jgi:diguanylate cyclase (GGDEF)-like protein/PAS domain S-box-containing protein
MEYENLSREELIEAVRELEIINRQLLGEKEEEIWLDYSINGNLGHWYWIIGTDRVIYNPLILTSLGYPEEELPEKPASGFFLGLLHPDDRQRVKNAMSEHLDGESHYLEAEYRIRATDDSFRTHFFRGSIVRFDNNGSPLLFSGMVFDITEKKETLDEEGQLIFERQPAADNQIRLNSRRALLDHLENEIGATKRLGGSLCIALFEIDDFNKAIEAVGREAGDGVLIETEELLSSSIRDSDFIGRFSETQFMIVYSFTSAKDAASITRRISRKIEGNEFKAGIKITVSGCVCEYHGEKLAEFIRTAENKLKSAKSRDGNTIVS